MGALIFCVCVWGIGMQMLPVVFNTEAGNYYSKSTFTVTVINTKLVFVVVILYIREIFTCFYKIVNGYPGIQRYPISGIRFLK